MVVVIDAVQLGTELLMSAIVVGPGPAKSSLTVLYISRSRYMRTISKFLILRSRSLMRVKDCH